MKKLIKSVENVHPGRYDLLASDEDEPWFVGKDVAVALSLSTH